MKGRWFNKREEPEEPRDEITLYVNSLDIDGEIQSDIAIEVAMKAAIDMIVFLKIAWNELVSEVNERGNSVDVTEEAQIEYMEIMGRLRASLIVVGEMHAFPEETMQVMRGLI